MVDGESVKTVQARLGHATAAETLDTYSHLWPDSDDRTREAVDSQLGGDSRAGCGLSADQSEPLSTYPQVSGLWWTSRAVGRVLSRAAVAGDAVTVIHLGWPLPTTSSALPACSGGPPSIARCLGLLRMGFTEPTWSPRSLVVSYTTVSPLLLPLARQGRSVLCGTVPRVTPGGCWPPSCPSEPGPSSAVVAHRRDRPPDSSAASVGVAAHVVAEGDRHRPARRRRRAAPTGARPRAARRPVTRAMTGRSTSCTSMPLSVWSMTIGAERLALAAAQHRGLGGVGAGALGGARPAVGVAHQARAARGSAARTASGTSAPRHAASQTTRPKRSTSRRSGAVTWA